MRRPRARIHLSRVQVAVASVAVLASALTVPASALAAAPSGQEDRIYLEPAAADSRGDAASAVEPKDAPRAAKKQPTHPPIARAQRIGDLRSLMNCRADSDRKWVVLSGPGDLQVAGWSQCRGTTWVFRAVAGVGHIGGITVRPDDFSGTVTIDRSGRASGSVGARLPWPGSVLPSGNASGRLILLPVGGRLVGEVLVQDSASSASLTMRGPVTDSGTFILSVTGSVDFASVSVPMRGSYHSGSNGVRGRGVDPTWLIRGDASEALIPGVVFAGPRLLISSAKVGIAGQAQARLGSSGITAPVTLSKSGTSRWRVAFQGSRAGTIRDGRVRGLELLADDIGGSIFVGGAGQTWAVSMPMTLVNGNLALRGTAELTGPRSLRLTPSTGNGDLFGTGREVVFTEAMGSATLTGRRVFGRMAVLTPGEQLFAMPTGWSSDTVLELTPRFGASGSATLERTVRYVVTKGLSRVVLAGALPASGPFRLRASGYLRLARSNVPVRGQYVGAGPRPSDSPGRLLVQADTDDAPNGRAIVSPGVWMTDTVITYATVPQAGSTMTARASSLPTVDYSISGSTVTLDVTTTSGEDISLSGTAKKEDGQYVITVSGSGGEAWEPFEGLSIPVNTISGTIYADDSASVNAWELETGEVSWDIANGIMLNTTLTLTSECPLEENCPEEGTTSDDSGTFYVGGSSNVTGIPSVAGVTIPDLEATGAFLADGSWVRWDGTTSDAVTVEGPADSSISMNNATVTIFSGVRDDTIPDLEMPDLSSVPGSNGVNVQVCGTFEVKILDFDTGEQEGCVGSTEVGKVLGQVKVGGVVSPTDNHGGLTLNAKNPPMLSGFAWSDIDPKSAGLSAAPVMGLYGQALSLVPKKNSLTADVVVPASLMRSLGTGINTDTSFVSTGWFETNGNFFLDLDIPVNLKASGASLQNIDLSIGRTKEAQAGSAFDFALDATGEVAVSGHHYPFDALIELKKDNTNNEAAVSLSVIGETSSQSIGTFDDASYLPEGDFEPAQTTLVDGNFDDSLPANDFSDGGFEAGTNAANLISDPSFEDSASFNLLPKEQSTFSGDTSGNILTNANYEDTDVMYNGDFEGVDGMDTPATNGPLGWYYTGTSDYKFTYSEADTGPSGKGTTTFCVQDTSSSYESYTSGLTQLTRPGVLNGGTYKLTGWVRGSASNQRALIQFKSGYSDASKALAIGSSWTYFELTGTGTSTIANAVVAVYLTAGKSSKVCFDDITFGRTSGASSDLVGSVKGPDYVEMFDTSVSSWALSQSSGIQRQNLSNGNYALKTDGCSDYWTFKDNSHGDLIDNKVPWDMSVNVYFNVDKDKEERADIGFLLSDSGPKATGYLLRLKTAGSSDAGGFYSVKDGAWTGFGGGMYNLSYRTWYNVRLVGWGNTRLYAQVTNLVTGSVTYSKYISDLKDLGTTGGSFGQFPDSKCQKDGDSSLGSWWDNFQLRTGSSGTGVILDAGQAHSGVGVARLDGGDSGWSGYTSVGEAISSGKTYTYSAWVKSATSDVTVTGNLAMKGVSNVFNAATSETIATQAFSVGSTWSQVRLTWTADSNYSDVAVGFTGMSSQGDILVDDQSFQQIPYERYFANNGAPPIVDVVPNPDDATDNVLLYQPLDSNPSALLYWVGKPFATTIYQLSANVRSASGTQKGSIEIWDGDGSSAVAMDFTATTTETTVGPIALTSKGGANNLRIAINLPGNASGIYIDDVVLTATDTTSGQTSGTLGKLPPISGWNAYPSTTKAMLVNQAAHAHSGTAYMRVIPDQMVGRVIPVNAIKGQTYTASVWLKAPNGDLTANVSVYGYDNGQATDDYAFKDVAIKPSGYTEVTLTLPITRDGIDQLRLWISGATSGKNLAVDDVSISLKGLSLVDPWRVSGNAGLVAVDDSINAHLSSDYLAVTGSSDSSIRVERTVKATTSARTFTAWVRTPPGSSPLSATLSLAQSDGGTGSVNFTADTTWRPVRVTMTGVDTSAAKTFTSRISLKSNGTLWVDDLVTADVTPFLPTSKDVTAGVTNQPGAASSLPNGLLVSAVTGQGVSAPIAVSKAISGGSSYTVSADIRAVSGKATGAIGLDFGSQAGTFSTQQTDPDASTSFAASEAWQRVTATFTAPSGSFTSLTPKFTLGGASGGTIYLDNVTVNPVRIELDQAWSPYSDGKGQSVDWGVWDDPANAHDGSLGVMKFKATGTGTAGMMTQFDRSSKSGEIYSATVWARTESGKTGDLKVEFRAQGNTDESVEESIQLRDEWQLINVRLPITRSHTEMRLSILTKTPGVQVYIDDASVVSNRWSTGDTSTRTNLVSNPSLETEIAPYAQQNGSTLTRTADRSYVGNYSGELKAADPAREGYVVYPLPGIKASTTYTISAYVWMPEGAVASDLPKGYDFYWFVDYGDSSKGVASIIKTIPPDYSKTMQWQRVSITMTTSAAPNANVRFMAPWEGGWFIDGLVVEQGSTASAYFEGTVPTTELTVVGDGPGAYEGTGYAQLSTIGSGGATMSTQASTSEGAISGTQHYTVYVRSVTGELLDVEASLSGSCSTSARSRVVGSDWEKLETNCEIRNSGALTMGVTLHTPGGVLAVDSVRLSNEPEKTFSPGYVYGVTSPLDHPDSGYRYLWDDAFGIRGLHLWGFSVQLSVDNGEPGLGVQATVYQDPKAVPNLFFGEDWIKGDATINISEAEPCFDFGFASVSSTGEDLGDSGISIADGALKAEDFHVAFAPRGCAVGEYTVSPGSSISFDALVGSGTLHFDLGLSRDDEGEPEFSGDLHVTELNIGGVDYRDLEMAVDVTPTDSSATYVADMQLPLGGFKGTFDMSASTSGDLHVDGQVQLTDWGWKSSSGKGFTINVFDFDMAMDVADDNCGTFVANADADASANFAAASNLKFSGHFTAECGEITEFQIVFDYVHGSLTEKFYLDYEDESETLAGGVEFEFQRKTSWKYLTHRYHRTARIAVTVDFVMDVANPSGSEAKIAADVQIANGSGHGECGFGQTGQPGDYCTIDIKVESSWLGTHEFSETW